MLIENIRSFGLFGDIEKPVGALAPTFGTLGKFIGHNGKTSHG